MGRQARGVRGMDLAEGDYLVGVEVVEKDGLILSIAENGYGKRTPLDDYRLTARGGKGVINMKTTSKSARWSAILSVKEDSDLMIVTKQARSSASNPAPSARRAAPRRASGWSRRRRR